MDHGHDYKMNLRKITPIVFIILIIVGLTLNFEFYRNTISPVNSSIENLDLVIGNSDPVMIQSHLGEIKQDLIMVLSSLPEGNKNPVWIYPTESTNFLRIENDIDAMVENIEKTSYFPKDSSAYQTGITDINYNANLIKVNLLDSKGFLYASTTNVFFTLIWLIGVAGFTKNVD